MLLYQNVLRGRPAQAFLKLLPLLQRGSTGNILEAYGEFYSSLAAGNYLSWQDYLLEEVSVLALFVQQHRSILTLVLASRSFDQLSEQALIVRNMREYSIARRSVCRVVLDLLD